MSLPAHIAVVDPAVKTPEIDCFNHLMSLSPLPLTYHLPALQGFKSLERENDNLRGVILFGSESSVNERLPWQGKLETWFQKKLSAGIPTFGCCYGHQMFAYMFGGAVDYRTTNHEKLVGFRQIELKRDRLWGEPQSGKLYVTHNEIVTTVPSELEIIATSGEVKVDGLRHKNLPLWSLQSHPEATQSFAKIDGILSGTGSDFDFGYGILKSFLNFCQSRS